MSHQMTAGHGGHMMPPADVGNMRALTISGWLTGLYFAVELGIGIWTGSVAVISDAFHTFSAVGGVLIAIVAGRLALRPATRYQTFGLMRAEIIGALINGAFLAGMSVFVLWMGAMRLRDPVELPTTPMLLAAAGGLVTEFISLGLLYKGQRTNLNIKGAYWHVLQTFGGSLIIILAALVIRYTGFLAIDPLAGMAFGLLLFWASWSIIRESLHILLDNVPKDLDLNRVKEAIELVPGVDSVHHLHAWSLTQGKNILSTHALVNDYASSEQARYEIQSRLKRDFGIYFSIIQVETEICADVEAAEEIDFLRQAEPPADTESGHPTSQDRDYQHDDR
jgi:cobalt-zinc-cadmium efflux system protein